MKNNAWIIKSFRHLFYIVVLLFLYVLQGTPRLFTLWGMKPVLVALGAICIAMTEGEFLGGVYGAFAGLLWDMTAGTLFGFHGIFLCICCTLIGLLSIHLMQVHLGNLLLFSFSTVFLIESIRFVFGDLLFQVENLGILFVQKVIFLSIWTAVFSPLFFFPIRGMGRFLKEKQANYERHS